MNSIVFAGIPRHHAYGPQIFPADAGRPACAESAPRIHRRANGSDVRIGWQQSVAKVHGGSRAETDVVADAVPSASAAGSFRDCRPSAREVSEGRRNDRAGRRVTADGALAATFPNTLPKSADPLVLVPSAWRNARASKPAITVTSELFEIAGIRAAEHWLNVRPTACPSRWYRLMFENLVAGFGRIPFRADGYAAFKRSIEAATCTDRKASEVCAISATEIILRCLLGAVKVHAFLMIAEIWPRMGQAARCVQNAEAHHGSK
ncbi:hypothetical protein BCO18430_05719 [Burkholderia contaminans]|nr:hypothetical protein BCO18430_05719 [Burkholderia contaminans]